MNKQSGEKLLAKVIKRLGYQEQENYPLVGKGGYASVYKVYNPALQEYYAIKILSGDPEARRRCLEEARSLAKCKHENVIRVYHVYEDCSAIVMEYFAGEHLDTIKNLKNSPEKLINLLIKVVMGLRKIHEEGLLHRDIKPNNILLSKDLKELKIIDLGIAQSTVEIQRRKSKHKEEDGLTQLSEATGTKGFMAPEVRKKGAAYASKKSDVYALGITFTLIVTEPNLDDYISASCTTASLENNLRENLQGLLRMGLERSGNEKFTHLLLCMIEEDQEKRISLEKLEKSLEKLKKEYEKKALLQKLRQLVLLFILLTFLGGGIKLFFDYKARIIYKKAIAERNSPDSHSISSSRKQVQLFSQVYDYFPETRFLYFRGLAYHQLFLKYQLEGSISRQEGFKCRDHALRDYDTAAQYEPYNIDVYFNRHFLHQNLNNYTEALADIEHCVAIASSPRIVDKEAYAYEPYRVVVLYKLEKYKSALDAIEKCLQKIGNKQGKADRQKAMKLIQIRMKIYIESPQLFDDSYLYQNDQLLLWHKFGELLFSQQEQGDTTTRNKSLGKNPSRGLPEKSHPSHYFALAFLPEGQIERK